MAAKRGHSSPELTPSSASLALLTTMVVAYNLGGVDALFDKYPADYEHRAIRREAPILQAHISLRVTLALALEQHRKRLFTAPRPRRAA